MTQHECDTCAQPSDAMCREERFEHLMRCTCWNYITTSPSSLSPKELAIIEASMKDNKEMMELLSNM